jgi:hypothetical protein
MMMMIGRLLARFVGMEELLLASRHHIGLAVTVG